MFANKKSTDPSLFQKPAKNRTSNTFQSSVLSTDPVHVVQHRKHIDPNNHSQTYFYGQNYEADLKPVNKHVHSNAFIPVHRQIDSRVAKQKELLGSQSNNHAQISVERLQKVIQKDNEKLTARDKKISELSNSQIFNTQRNRLEGKRAFSQSQNFNSSFLVSNAKWYDLKSAKIQVNNKVEEVQNVAQIRKLDENKSILDQHNNAQYKENQTQFQKTNFLDSTNEQQRRANSQFSDLFNSCFQSRERVPFQQQNKQLTHDSCQESPTRKKILLQKSELDNHDFYKHLSQEDQLIKNKKFHKDEHWNGLVTKEYTKEQLKNQQLSTFTLKLQVSDDSFKKNLKSLKDLKEIEYLRIKQHPDFINQKQRECTIIVQSKDKQNAIKLISDLVQKQGNDIIELDGDKNCGLKYLADKNYQHRVEITKRKNLKDYPNVDNKYSYIKTDTRLKVSKN